MRDYLNERKVSSLFILLTVKTLLKHRSVAVKLYVLVFLSIKSMSATLNTHTFACLFGVRINRVALYRNVKRYKSTIEAQWCWKQWCGVKNLSHLLENQLRYTAISINVVGSKHKAKRQDRKFTWDFYE